MIRKLILIFFILNLTVITQIGFASPTSSAALGGPESVANHRVNSVVGTKGMVVSDDQIASEWGAEILRRGGNAVDAAVATAFALAVTRPHYAALGGGGFFLFCPAPSADSKSAPKCHAIDYREQAPRAAFKDMYIQKGKPLPNLSRNGALASGIPGVTAGLLLALEKFGTLPRQKLMTKPIHLAQNGFTFTSHLEDAATARWASFNNAAKEIFGCKLSGQTNLSPCPPGTLIKQPHLANVLKKISALGAKGFYEGTVAKQISSGIQNSGGILTTQDLLDYHPTSREPLHGDFRDSEIVTMPPPSSGGAILLQLLNYSKKAEQAGSFKGGFGSSELVHALTHAMALSFADRAHYFGDPDFVNVPLQSLLSPSYTDQQWKTFQTARARIPSAPGNIPIEPQHTTHFSVIDRYGNAVAITTTVNDNFGSGFVPPGTGIVMNNEMDDFSIAPGSPNIFKLVGAEANSIAAHKRPLSSMTPTIVRDKTGTNRIIIGAAGGPRIITSVFLSLFNRLQLEMPLSDAVSAPRFHEQWQPTTLFVERFGFPAEVRNALEKKGYVLEDVAGLGKIHALERFPNGRVWGVPDPRSEGAAAAE